MHIRPIVRLLQVEQSLCQSGVTGFGGRVHSFDDFCASTFRNPQLPVNIEFTVFDYSVCESDLMVLAIPIYELLNDPLGCIISQLGFLDSNFEGLRQLVGILDTNWRQ